MYIRTPYKITTPISDLCKDLAEESKPRFVKVTPMQSSEINDCFTTVQNCIKERGGTVCYGWAIWEWPRLFIEAEFHAIWVSPRGNMKDVSKRERLISQILFLPDPQREYDGKQINNIRRALINDPIVQKFFDTFDKEFEIKNRGARVTQHGKLDYSDAEKFNLRRIYQDRLLIQNELIDLSRNWD